MHDAFIEASQDFAAEFVLGKAHRIALLFLLRDFRAMRRSNADRENAHPLRRSRARVNDGVSLQLLAIRHEDDGLALEFAARKGFLGEFDGGGDIGSLFGERSRVERGEIAFHRLVILRHGRRDHGLTGKSDQAHAVFAQRIKKCGDALLRRLRREAPSPASSASIERERSRARMKSTLVRSISLGRNPN